MAAAHSASGPEANGWRSRPTRPVRVEPRLSRNSFGPSSRNKAAESAKSAPEWDAATDLLQTGQLLQATNRRRSR